MGPTGRSYTLFLYQIFKDNFIGICDDSTPISFSFQFFESDFGIFLKIGVLGTKKHPFAPKNPTRKRKVNRLVFSFIPESSQSMGSRFVFCIFHHTQGSLIFILMSWDAYWFG